MTRHDRNRSPLSPHAWREIDQEASRVLTATLSARRICDVVRTDDWSRSALPLGSARSVDVRGAAEGTVWVREARPLIELRVPFSIDREVVRELERKSPVPHLDTVTEAAREFARIEDAILYDGVPSIGAPGLRSHAEHKKLNVPSVGEMPVAVARAVELLRRHGIAGPYSLVPSGELITQMMAELAPSGRPVIDHVRRAVEYIGTPAQGLSGALVCSRRGGDFRLHLGRGAHVVFEWEDADRVHFSITQTMALEFGGRDALVCIEAPKETRAEAPTVPRGLHGVVGTRAPAQASGEAIAHRIEAAPIAPLDAVGPTH